MGLCNFLRKVKLKFLANAIIAIKCYIYELLNVNFWQQKIKYHGLGKTIGDELFIVKNRYQQLKRRIRIKMTRKVLPECILVAGPYVGELGFEISEWIPYIKNTADTCQCRVHVFTRNGHLALYPFADKAQTFDFSNMHIEKNWLFFPPQDQIELSEDLENQARKYAKKLRSQGTSVIVENCGYNNMDTIFKKKTAVLLESLPDLIDKWGKKLPETKKIVLTYRGVTRDISRNSDIDLLNRLAGFIKGKGWTPIIVGRTDENFSVLDVMGVNLINQTSIADLIAIYKISSAVVGSSTGIIHLAAACGTPHITWGSTHIDDTVVERYNELWNLNNTPVRFLTKNWQGEFEDISKALIELIWT